MDKVLHDSDVIITGVAGCFPKSRNVSEFLDNLFNGRDLTSDVPHNWKVALPNLPPKIGKVNGLEKFDSGYFGIHHQQATDMDPACRKLLEMSVEVLLDAGINPIEMRGSRTGVYICTMYTETENLFYGPKLGSPTLGMTGCTRSSYAQRISYHLGLEGPSVCLDAACSGSMYAMEMAIRAIRAGECNNALVGGANLLLNRNVLMQSSLLGLLSPSAKPKVFDQSEDGYVRSEAVSLIFLQKFKDAKRIYAQIVQVRTNCDGFKEEGISHPSSEMLVELIEGLYGKVGIDPTTVSFVECHATGTRQSDFEELSAINDTFCKGRVLPLVVGSVKANMGHSEAASGLCSLIKILGSMEIGCIPPQIHCDNLRDDIEAFRSGKCTIARQCLPLGDLDGEYWAMNNSGFGGTNAHVLLRNCMGFNPNLLNTSPEKYQPIRAPLISPLIQWNHAEDWPVYEYNTAIPLGYELHNITFQQVSKELNFLLEHQIDGRSIFPSTGYLCLAWKTFCQMMGLIMEETSVAFQELRFYQACVLTKDTDLNLVVHISRMGKKFEITQSDNLLASGTIKIKRHETVTHTVKPPFLAEDAIFTEDIYTKLDLHGYEHKGVFRALQGINHKSTQALSKWTGNWIAFLDTALQVTTFQLESLTLSLPTAISYFSVDPSVRPTLETSIFFQRETRKVWSDGVEIRNVTLTPTPKKTHKPILESYQFVPFVALLPSAIALKVNIQLIMENLQTKTLSIMEMQDQFSTGEVPLTPILEKIIEDIPHVILTHSSPAQLVIMSSASQRPQVAQKEMEKSQFLLSREISSSGGLPQMEIVTEYQTEEEFLVLLKAVRDFKEPTVINLRTHGWLKSLQSTLNANQDVLLTDNNSKSGILGLLNSLSLEVRPARVSCAFNTDEGRDALLEDQMQKRLRFNVLKAGQWGTYRHLPLDGVQEFPYEYITTKSEVLYAGLHLRYVNEELTGIVGLEYSCVNSSGKRVMGLKDLSWDIPKEWSLEDATTVPLTYATILYALIEVAKLRFGQSVLILGGDSIMGIAATSVVHHYKCNVFNMDTSQKGNYHHYSRTVSEIGVMKKTKGRGVDIILNCLKESKLRTFVHYLATGGKLIEFGHSDVPLQVANLQYNRGFYWIDQNSVAEMVRLSSLVSKGIDLGYVRPLPRVTYDSNEVENACRYLASNATTKRVIIRMSSPHLQIRTNRFRCDPRKVYVLVGGLGGLGLEMTDWLIARNCRKMVMATRSNPKGYQKYKIRRWTESGVQVVVECRDLSEEKGCDALLRIASALGEVDAIFNLAASLRDGLLEKQTESTFAVPFRSKVTITEHLDRTSRTMSPTLRYFVVFSSMSAGRGFVGVTNYAMANSAMERICEERKRDGFPALAIQWGAIGSVGLMRDSPDTSRISGSLSQSVSSFLRELGKLLVRQEPIVSCMVLASKDKLEPNSNDIMRVEGRHLPPSWILTSLTPQ